MEVFIQVLVAILVFALLFDMYMTLAAMHQASLLVSQTDFKGEHIFPSISQQELTILVDGDSVAAGVGASTFNRSLAGRVGSHFKENYTVRMYNNAKSGSKVSDLLTKSLPQGRHDLAVITIVSNDLLRFTWIRSFRDPVRQVYDKYSQVADTVIVIGPGLVSETSGIPRVSVPYYSFMGPLYGIVMSQETEGFGNVTHVDPYQKELDYKKYGKTEAKDRFHPNDNGHKYWYDMFVYGLNKSGFRR